MMEAKKRLLLIATGGTIASRKSESGLTPQITPKELMEYVPNIREICECTVVQLLNLDSSNMRPEHWRLMVEEIQRRYEEYDGFVITHGTDTMAYTAAALSYMIQNSWKPIVITGSQKPIDLDITDAKTNLIDSFIYAADEDSHGVRIIFDGKVIAGTRAKKVRSKSYNAFSSMDFPFLAVIQEGRIIRYLPDSVSEEPVRFFTEMNDSIFLLKLIPGIKPDILPFIFDRYDAIIIESFGVGGIPKAIREEFHQLCQAHPNKMIVMATQVAHEGSDMTVYEVGNEMKELCNFLESYDMTLESVIAKTMWMLANVSDNPDVREEVFYRKINEDVLFYKGK